MSEQMPFVNREKELAQIDEAIRDWGHRRVLHFCARGGIGKTRLLQEAYKRYRYPQTTSLVPPAAGPLTVTAIHEFTQTEWSEHFIRGLRETAGELGIRLTERDADFDLDRMAAHLEEAAQDRPDALIIRLGSSEKLRPGIEKAITSGVKVLTVDNFLQRIDGLVCRITTDEHEGARLSCEKMVADIGFRGKVAALFIAGVGLQENRRTFLLGALSQYPDIELIASTLEIAPNMEEVAAHEARRLLSEHPDLKAFWITWDQCARGVVKTLLDEDRADVGVYSFDLLSPGDEDLIRAPNSPWRATVAVNPAEVGREAMRLAARAAAGEAIPPHRAMPMRLITQEALRSAPERASIWSGVAPGGERLLLTEIIDFDDETFADFTGFTRALATRIGRDRFQDFLEELSHFFEMQVKMPGEPLDYLRRAVEEKFLTCLRRVTEQQRVVIFLDTLEKAGKVAAYLARIASKVDNIAILAAGRPCASPQDDPFAAFPELPVERIDLPPFGVEERRKYLQEKQERLHAVLDAELAERLLNLTAGVPILIDLAVESCMRETPPAWLLQWNVQDVPTLAELQDEAKKRDFEMRLVREIMNTRRPLDWLTLMLAYVYPMDRDLVARLLEFLQVDVDALIDEARSHVFIKSLPDGRLSLHDEMRRMLREYVWPEVDPGQNRRSEISRTVVAYLDGQMGELRRQLDHPNMLTGEELAFSQLVERLRILEGMKLYHLLKVNVAQGVDLFEEIFDRATERYDYGRRRNWVEFFEERPFGDESPLLAQLNSNQRARVFLCKAKTMLDEARYEEAHQTLAAIAPQDLPLVKQVDLAIQQANIAIRRGYFQQGIESFQRAVQLSQGDGDDVKRWRVKAINGLGWAYRLVADFEKAREQYEQALELAIEQNLIQDQATIYNNLGFAYAYKTEDPGHKETALRFCQEGLRLAQERAYRTGDMRAVGRSYSTLGCVAFMAGQIEQSLSYFQRALDIFEPAQDKEWLSQVYSWRGVALMSGPNRDLGLAERDLLQAQEFGIPKEQPMILSRLSLIHLLQGKIDQAEQEVKLCREKAFELPDPWYQWVSLRDMARVARYKKEYHRLSEFETAMEEHVRTWPNPDKRATGMLYLELGSLALGQHDLNKALSYLKRGLKILTDAGRYGGDTPEIHVERLQKEIFVENLNLPAEQIREIGTAMLEFWREEKLHIVHPGVRAVLSRWANWETPQE